MIAALLLACLAPAPSCVDVAQALHRLGDACQRRGGGECYRPLRAAWSAYGERCLGG